ncbi:MAG: TolC family protein [Bacillota bacterium]
MKKFVSIILIVFMLAVMLQSYAKDDSGISISYDSARETMLKNNRTIKSLQLAERKAYYQYSSAVQGTKGINTEGFTTETPYGDMHISFPGDFQILLTKQKELYPLSMKYYWDMTNSRKLTTEKALELGLRDLYLGFMKAHRDYDMGLKKLELAKKKYNVSKLRFDQGHISKLEFEEAEYNLTKSQKDMEAAARSKENMLRTFNSYIGVPIDTGYDKVIYKELSSGLVLKPVDYYIEKALSERLEITSLMEEIKLKELHLSILKKNRANEIYVKIRKEYDDVSRELESLKIKLEKAKLDVEDDIKSAYIDIKKEGYNVKSMAETLNMQKRSYEKLESQYKQGLMPRIALDEMEIGLRELKNGFDLVVYGYNTKLMKLNEAAGIGPAY